MRNITTSKAQTQALARRFVKLLNGGEVLLLSGELGSGKTTFAQGLLQFFGIHRGVTSPTFVLKKSYPLAPNKQNIKRIHHLDLYRLSRLTDLTHLDLESCFRPHDLTLIEWGEKIADFFSDLQSVYQLTFEVLPKDRRRITIQSKV